MNTRETVHIFVLGISHKFAGVAAREKLAFTQAQAQEALRRIIREGLADEAVILSTCNRVEIYGMTRNSEGTRTRLTRFLARYHHLAEEEMENEFFFRENEEAITHLYRVACGLDSMVIGENEILGQLKESFRQAVAAGAVRSIFHQLFNRAFRTAKLVRQQTKIGEGFVSVSSVAVELAQKILGDFHNKKLLILGTGKMSELTLKKIIKAGAGVIWVTSRRYFKAQELADKYAVQAIAYEDWKSHFTEADMLLCSTSAPHPVVLKSDVEAVMQSRKHKPLFIIDIAVPRDTEADVSRIEDVYLYNIDDLKGLCEANMNLRRRELRLCEEILQKQAAEFAAWLKQLHTAPVINKLNLALDRILEEELKSRSAAGFKDKEELRRILERVKAKFLREPMVKLREAMEEGSGTHYLEVLYTLFDLEKVTTDEYQEEDSHRQPGEQAGLGSEPDYRGKSEDKISAL